jgi:hypothetical protein
MRTKAEQDQQHRTYRNTAIGYVEGGVIPVAVINLDEIGDLRSVQAIDQIAERATNHQGQRQGRAPFATRGARQPPREYPVIASPSTTKNQRCQPPLSARKLKAAPVLKASVQLRMPGMTGCGMPAGGSAESAHHLVSWSMAIHSAESSSQGSALGLKLIIILSAALDAAVGWVSAA